MSTEREALRAKIDDLVYDFEQAVGIASHDLAGVQEKRNAQEAKADLLVAIADLAALAQPAQEPAGAAPMPQGPLPHAIEVPGFGWVDAKAVRAVEAFHSITAAPQPQPAQGGAAQAQPAEATPEPDCWAILTPSGSKLVSPDEAKGCKGAYPLHTRLPATPVAPPHTQPDELSTRILALSREVKNELSLSGLLTAAMHAMVESNNEPDGWHAVLVGLAHDAVDRSLKAAASMAAGGKEPI